MTTWYPIELVCPVCETTFTSNSIGSCGHASKRTDFRPNYWGFNPVRFFYHNCPECGFCAPYKYYQSKFENPAFREEIESLGPLPELDFFTGLEVKLERAMVCLETMNDFGIISLNEYDLANYWIEAYWWAKNPNLIQKCGEIVLQYFNRALEKNLIPEEMIFQINYLIAEIHRRIGHEERANELFNEVISLTKDEVELEWIYKLAVQQKTSPQEDFPSTNIKVLI
ncbi:MAG: DUF2225 domain-containing protein [Candidatus Helarchaeota archaeon]|nr:DUF2225 domain-containing protein [Candidatus Helarchaeota archaeon]